MIAAVAPTQESLFHAQYQYIAQTFVQNHAYQAQQWLKGPSAGQLESCPNSDLTMVTRVGLGTFLTNPRFPIESCLDSL